MIDLASALPGWRPLLADFADSDAARGLQAFLAARRAGGAVIYPPQPLQALWLTAPDAVRVVILGQDPYHGPGQAHGLAFSVPAGVPAPPSLRNILAEVQADVGGARHAGDTDLTRWARQGVLLLNTVFTVEDGAPASHAGRGWEALSSAIVMRLAGDTAPKVFLLWGRHAQAARAGIEAAGHGHAVFEANHPSPLSARRPPVPFIGCRHFSKANAVLGARGRGAVDWGGVG